MNAENLQTMQKKADSVKKFDHDSDRMAVDNAIRMADNNMLRRKQEILDQSRKNDESEKKA